MERDAVVEHSYDIGWRRRLRRYAQVFRRAWRYMGPGWLVCVAYLDPGNMFSDILSGSQYAYSQLWVIWWSQWFALFVGWLCARLVLVSAPLEDFATAERKHYRKPGAARYLLWLFAELVVVVADIPEVIGFAFGMNILTGVPVWVGVLLSFVATSLVLLLELGDFRLVEATVALCVFALGIVLLVSLARSGLDGKQFMLGWLVPTFQGGQSVYDALSIIGSVVMPHNLYLQTGSLIAHHTAAFVALDIIEKVQQDEQDDEKAEESELTSSLSENVDGDQNPLDDLESALSQPSSSLSAEGPTGGCLPEESEYVASTSAAEERCPRGHESPGAATTGVPARATDLSAASRKLDRYDLSSEDSTESLDAGIQPASRVCVSSRQTCEGANACRHAPFQDSCHAGDASWILNGWQLEQRADMMRVQQSATRIDGKVGETGSIFPVDVVGVLDIRLSPDSDAPYDEIRANSICGKRSDQENVGDAQSIGDDPEGCPACAPVSLPAIGPVILELVLPTCFAFFVNAAATSIAAEHVHPSASQATVNLGLYNFCQFLPFEGACVLWGLILLISGTASTVTTTLTGSYVMSGFLHMRIPLLLRAALARGLAIMPALVVAATSGPATVNAIIGVVNTTLSVGLPIVLVPLLRCSHERKALHWFPHAAGWLFTAFIFGLNLYGLCAPQGGMFGLYTGSTSNFTWSVQANILQDLVILLYVGVVAWLALA